jgi:AcrR family transcriptional regulator
VARWEPGAPDRLQEAAFELLAEQPYDDVTVAAIAERAGLTKRTFFRYFADKREVLFWRSEALLELFAEAVSAAPAGAAPLEAGAAGVEACAAFLDGRRPFSLRRWAIISAQPELQERELIKLARLTDSVSEALVARGVDAVTARIAGEATIAVFRVAFEHWVQPEETRSFGEVASATLEGFRAVAAA